MGEAALKRSRYNERMREVEMPPRVRALPVSAEGYPVPWFVAWLNEARTEELRPGWGTPDFRIIGKGRIEQAVTEKVCWVCGRPFAPPHVACVIGPMCAVNRISSEPPSHVECARFAATACPFLTRPKMRRNEKGMDAMELAPAPGNPILSNPGVALVWVTAGVQYYARDGLFLVGDPVAVEWYAEGRRATRAESEAALEGGLPALEAACDREHDADACRLEIRALAAQARKLLPLD